MVMMKLRLEDAGTALLGYERLSDVNSLSVFCALSYLNALRDGCALANLLCFLSCLKRANGTNRDAPHTHTDGPQSPLYIQLYIYTPYPGLVYSLQAAASCIAK